MSHRLTLNWAGGEHAFALGLGQLRAVQQNTGAGPEQLLQRMARGEWLVDDLIEVLRQGLIGAGMEAREAGPLVLRTAEQHALHVLKEPAYRVLAAALVGVEDDPVGEPRGPETAPENGSSAASMARAR